LLQALVRIDGGITCSSRHALMLSVWNVLLRLRILVSLRQAKIDHVHDVCLLPAANQEVIRLDVAVNEPLGVEKFDPVQQLIGQHQTWSSS